MAGVYVHLSGGDVEKKILEHYGKTKGDDKPQAKRMISRDCARCGESNPSTDKFCGKCSMPLDLRTAMELERGTNQIGDKMDTLLNDPKVRQTLKERAIALGIISQ